MRRIELAQQFAVFSDVHGNLPALEAVLGDVQTRGVAGPLCLGDLVGYGPWPNEVAEVIRERGIPCLMGNYDQGIGFATGDCGCVYRTAAQRAEGAASLEWTTRAVNDETRAFLRSLEDRFLLVTPAGELLAVHGSPRRINEYLFEDRPASAMERMARAYTHPAILFGHTHLPYARRVAETIFVNVGSAGRPKDGDWRACYAVIDPQAYGTDGFARFVRVPYDYARLQAGLKTTSLITSFAGPGDE